MSCFLGHKWQGCTCTKCGKVRDKNHDWIENCQKCAICGHSRQEAHNWQGCVCTKCKQTRDMNHNWKTDCEKCSMCGQIRDHYHKWDGCKCTKCGKTRDENHAWNSNCEKCSICGETRPGKHQWNGCICSVCGATRDKGHDWILNCEVCANCAKIRHNAHDWSRNCEICARCGATREGEHDFEDGICSKCGINENDPIDTDLLSAIYEDNISEVIRLLDGGSNTNGRDDTGWTPLMYATMNHGNNCIEIMRTLIDQGANINAIENKLGESVLIIALVEKNEAAASYLIDSGANVNTASNDGMTPLMFAANYGFTVVFKSLVDHGADCFATMSEGWTVYDYICNKGYMHLVELMDYHKGSGLGNVSLENGYINAFDDNDARIEKGDYQERGYLASLNGSRLTSVFNNRGPLIKDNAGDIVTTSVFIVELSKKDLNSNQWIQLLAFRGADNIQQNLNNLHFNDGSMLPLYGCLCSVNVWTGDRVRKQLCVLMEGFGIFTKGRIHIDNNLSMQATINGLGTYPGPICHSTVDKMVFAGVVLGEIDLDKLEKLSFTVGTDVKGPRKPLKQVELVKNLVTDRVSEDPGADDKTPVKTESVPAELESSALVMEPVEGCSPLMGTENMDSEDDPLDDDGIGEDNTIEEMLEDFRRRNDFPDAGYDPDQMAAAFGYMRHSVTDEELLRMGVDKPRSDMQLLEAHGYDIRPFVASYMWLKSIITLCFGHGKMWGAGRYSFNNSLTSIYRIPGQGFSYGMRLGEVVQVAGERNDWDIEEEDIDGIPVITAELDDFIVYEFYLTIEKTRCRAVYVEPWANSYHLNLLYISKPNAVKAVYDHNNERWLD